MLPIGLDEFFIYLIGSLFLLKLAFRLHLKAFNVNIFFLCYDKKEICISLQAPCDKLNQFTEKRAIDEKELCSN